MKLLTKFILLISLVLMTCLTSNGKTLEKDKNYKIDSVRIYYQYTNKAELAIIDSNFSEAQINYELAFKFKRPNPKDLHNALYSSSFIEDCDFGRRCLSQLVKVRYYLVKDSLAGKQAFYNCISEGYRENYFKYWNQYKQSPLFKKLDSIFDVDQSIREVAISDNEFVAIDALLNQELLTLLLEKGFQNVEDGVWYGNAGNQYSVLFLLRWHRRGLNSILDSILLSNTLVGNFEPVSYAILTSFQQNSKYGVYFQNGKQWTGQERKLIDDNRAKIYLESLSDYEKKMSAQLKIDSIRNQRIIEKGLQNMNSGELFFNFIPGNYIAPTQ